MHVRPLSSETIHIAILICEVLPPPIAALRGPFDQIFQTFFDRGLKRFLESQKEKYSGPKEIRVKTTPYNATTSQLPDAKDLESIDALVITGSTAGAYEDIEWVKNLGAFLQDTYSHHPQVKIFGTCFGHQIINQSLFAPTGGLNVKKNPKGWELGVHEITITPKFAACFPRQFKSRSNTSPLSIQLQLSHQDAVFVTEKRKLPSECVEVGSSGLCGMQGMYVPNRVLTFQAHPEFDRAVNGAAIKWIGETSWSAETTKEYLRMADKDDDSEMMGEIVMEFLLHASG